MTSRNLRLVPLFLFCLMLPVFSPAQEAAAQPAAAAQKEQPKEEPNQVRAAEPSAAEQKAAEESKEAENDQNAQFRQSPSVKWLAAHTGLPLGAAFWVFMGINFAILAFAIGRFVKLRAPQYFRERGDQIRRSLEEARQASEEARARLGQIESRLARMDAEIGEMRAAAEREAAAEEERIRAAAADDQHRILAAAEQEIDAATRLARRELKAYAAALAVELAERRIQVDANTDRALVHNFSEQFGKDGQ